MSVEVDEHEGDNRPSVYEEDGIWVYRASAIGNCLKNLVAHRLEMGASEHPDWLLKAFDEGKKNEPIILQMLKDEGEFKFLDEYELTMRGIAGNTIRMVNGQFEAVIPIGKSAMIRGHTDGIVQRFVKTAEWDSGDRRVVEAKAFAKSFYDKYKKLGLAGFPYYVAQVSSYMHATGLPCLFVVGLKDEHGVVQSIEKEYIDTPPMSIGQLKAIVAKVESCAAKGELPGCTYEQYPCQFFWLHEKPEAKEGMSVDDVEEVLLESLGQQYLEGQATEKEGKKKKKIAGDAIKEWFDEKREDGEGKVLGINTVETSKYTIEDFRVPMPESTRPAYELRYPKITEKKEDKTKDKEEK